MPSTTELPKGMLAARAHGGSTEVHLDTIPLPEIGPVDVLIKVAAAGLALGVFANVKTQRYKHTPTVIGHEVAGTIVAIGADVSSASLGDRVRLHPNLSCRQCKFCVSDREQMCPDAAMMGFLGFGKGEQPLFEKYHNGGLAEYVKAPYWLIDSIPENVGFDVAAKVQDLACAVRALKCADLQPRSTVIVTAATGSMGVSTLKLAEFFPIGRLILVARSAERLREVQRLSKVPTEIIALDELGDWPVTEGLVRKLREIAPAGADAIIDYMPGDIGADIWQVMGGLGFGGSLVHMGGNGTMLPLPVVALMVHCWKIVGTRGNTRSDAKFVLDKLSDGTLNVDELVSHRFALRDLKQVVLSVTHRSPPMWMGVVHP